MVIHSSILAWRIPWTEEPDRLQSIGSHRIGHDWSDWACRHSGYTLSGAGIKSVAFLLLGYSCFTVLFSAVRQWISHMCTCVPFLLSLPLIPTFHSSRLLQSTEASSLCYSADSLYQSRGIFLHMAEHMLQSQSPDSSASRVYTSALYICFSIPALQIGSSVPFF